MMMVVMTIRAMLKKKEHRTALIFLISRHFFPNAIFMGDKTPRESKSVLLSTHFTLWLYQNAPRFYLDGTMY